MPIKAQGWCWPKQQAFCLCDVCYLLDLIWTGNTPIKGEQNGSTLSCFTMAILDETDTLFPNEFHVRSKSKYSSRTNVHSHIKRRGWTRIRLRQLTVHLSSPKRHFSQHHGSCRLIFQGGLYTSQTHIITSWKHTRVSTVNSAANRDALAWWHATTESNLLKFAGQFSRKKLFTSVMFNVCWLLFLFFFSFRFLLSGQEVPTLCER